MNADFTIPVISAGSTADISVLRLEITAERPEQKDRMPDLICIRESITINLVRKRKKKIYRTGQGEKRRITTGQEA